MSKDKMRALLGLMSEHNVSLDDLAAVAAEADDQPKRKKRSRKKSTATVDELKAFKSSLATAQATDASAPAPATATKRQRKARKYEYGTAPTAPAFNPAGTAKMREDALDAEIPGILAACEIRHVGKDHKKRFTTSLRAMVNEPWTWVRLDKGKSIGQLSNEEIRARLAKCGYAFSGASKCWCTSSAGKPPLGGGNAIGVGRWAMNQDD